MAGRDCEWTYLTSCLPLLGPRLQRRPGLGNGVWQAGGSGTAGYGWSWGCRYSCWGRCCYRCCSRCRLHRCCGSSGTRLGTSRLQWEREGRRSGKGGQEREQEQFLKKKTCLLAKGECCSNKISSLSDAGHAVDLKSLFYITPSWPAISTSVKDEKSNQGEIFSSRITLSVSSKLGKKQVLLWILSSLFHPLQLFKKTINLDWGNNRWTQKYSRNLLVSQQTLLSSTFLPHNLNAVATVRCDSNGHQNNTSKTYSG